MSFKHFLVGFAIGASIGATIVLLKTPRSGKETLRAITTHVRDAIREGKKAAAFHEQQLWEEFRSHLQGTVPLQNGIIEQGAIEQGIEPE